MAHARRRDGRPWRKVIKHRVAYVLIRAFYATCSVLPEPVINALGRTVGWLLCFTPVCQAAKRHIRLAYGDAPPSAQFPSPEALARGCMRHYGRLLSEMLLLERWQADLLSRCQDRERLAAMAARIMGSGQGVVFATGHIGNWEVFGRAIAAGGYKVMALARAAFSPEVAAWLVRWRRQGGVLVANRGSAASIRAIRDIKSTGAGLGVLVDVDTKVKSVFVPFFGRLAKTPTAAADLALKLGTRLVVAWSWREQNGRFAADAVEIPVPHGVPEQERAAVVLDLTRQITAALEQAIRAHPDQWMWSHRRWRSKEPPPERVSQGSSTT